MTGTATGTDLALWLGRKHCRLRLREFGELAGRIDDAAVSVALTRWQRRVAADPTIAKHAAKAARMCRVGGKRRSEMQSQ